MIWSSKTHDFTCTNCNHIGGPCADAGRLAKALADTIAIAWRFTAPDFEVSGHGRLQGCARTCCARFVARKAAVRIYCDVEAEADADTLEALADAFLTSDRSTVAQASSRLDAVPSGIVQAVPRQAAVDAMTNPSDLTRPH